MRMDVRVRDLQPGDVLVATQRRVEWVNPKTGEITLTRLRTGRKATSQFRVGTLIGVERPSRTEVPV